MPGLFKNTKSKKTVMLVLAGLVVFLFFGLSRVLALEVGLNEVERTIQLTGTDIRVIIARIINVMLGLLGVAALFIMLWGGFQWMMAGGEEDKITKAKRTIINGVIGLVIVLSAFAITRFVLTSLLGAIIGGGGRAVRPAPEIILRSGSLGRGIIDMHYPARGQTDVPRNTNIMITFKQPVFLPSIIEGYEVGPDLASSGDDTLSGALITPTTIFHLKTNALKIYKASEGISHVLGTSEVDVHFTPNHLSFVFDPTGYLGSSSENVLYTVDLPGGSDGLRLERNARGDAVSGGVPAFAGDFARGYAWQFTTNTTIDVTPPEVTECFPICPHPPDAPPADTAYDRNVLIQVTFNEAIDPTSVTFDATSTVLPDVLHNVTVGSPDATTYVHGQWMIANNYRTVEFVPDEPCGTNSCGETIYCLPRSAAVNVTVKAAALMSPASSDQPYKAVAPYNGVVDTCGNSLNDHGNDAVASGPPGDNVVVNFNTNSTINLTAPQIENANPGNADGSARGEIVPDAVVDATFNKPMSRASLNSSAITLTPDPVARTISGRSIDLSDGFWYSLSSTNLGATGAPVTGREIPTKTRADVNHTLFLRVDIGEAIQYYLPRILGRVSEVPLVTGVRDAYQNCFVPVSGPGCTGTTSKPYCCNGIPSSSAECPRP